MGQTLASMHHASISMGKMKIAFTETQLRLFQACENKEMTVKQETNNISEIEKKEFKHGIELDEIDCTEKKRFVRRFGDMSSLEYFKSYHLTGGCNREE